MELILDSVGTFMCYSIGIFTALILIINAATSSFKHIGRIK